MTFSANAGLLVAAKKDSDSKTWQPELDTMIVAPENHVVLHEDEFIRVLSVRLPAGETEKPRDNHPCILPNGVKNFQHKGLKNQKGTAEAMP